MGAVLDCAGSLFPQDNRVGKGSNLFPPACGIVWAFPPTAVFTPLWNGVLTVRRKSGFLIGLLFSISTNFSLTAIIHYHRFSIYWWINC